MTGIAIRKQTISAQVADAIRRKILSGQWPSGQALRQEHLAAELGVSRIPVREALHQLHSEGLVDLVSHKGAVVSSLPMDEILELHQLRAHVETWLLELAVPCMTPADIAEAGAAEADFAEAAAGGAYDHDLNWKFHSALYAPSRRPASIALMAKVHQRIERHTNLLVRVVDDRRDGAAVEHGQILGLCRAGDARAASKALQAHILKGGLALVARLKELRGDAG